jgi:predicted membrane-bound spermidine synthase
MIPTSEPIVPFGYANPREHRPISLALLTIRLFLVFGTFLLAFDQLFLVQPKLYLAPLGEREATVFRALAVIMIVTGVLSARRFWPKQSNAPYSLLLTASLVALTCPCRFTAFDGPISFAYFGNGVALGAALSLGASLHYVVCLAKIELNQNSYSRVLLHPIASTSIVVLLVTAAILSNAVGPMRSGIAIGGGLTATAMTLLLEAPKKARHRFGVEIASALFFTLRLGAIGIETLCPLERVLSSSHPLVFTAKTDKTTIDMTVGQGGVHYFVNGELRYSSIDDARWANSLVAPALFRVESPKRALVLSLGEGVIERELLALSPTISITSVTRDARLGNSVKRQAYLRRVTRDSLNSPRVTLIEQDPAVYALKEASTLFDLIIVDLPDPSTYFEVKYYSRYFYQRLAARLVEKGVLVVQATSARRSPRSFAVIGATLRAAGFEAAPFMVPLIARGEWSLYLCTRGALPSVREKERYLKTFAGSLERQLMSPSADTLPPKDFVAVPNTLNDAVLLDWFEQESEDPHHG